MMNIEQLKSEMPDFAKDIKLNLSTVLTTEGSPDLTQNQIMSIALASAYITHNQDVISSIANEANQQLSSDEIVAAKAAATIMAMNNIYYRFTHTMTDATYSTMPAKLRMNVMTNPDMNKIIFELSSLAVSAINGCGKCMNAHVMQLEKAGLSKQAIQSTVRIASVINAAATVREITG